MGSTRLWTRVWPQGLAGRFALLLVGALVAVNLVAVALLSSERQRLGREINESREIRRLVSLAPLMQAVPAAERERIAGLASDRFARVSVGPEPWVGAGETDAPSSAVARQALAELGSEPSELRVEVGDRSGRRGADRQRSGRGEDIALSMLLEGSGALGGQWLNIAARSSGRRLAAITGRSCWCFPCRSRPC